MGKVTCNLTVFFEEPFWVGIFERIEDGRLSVSKVTFGAEPKDYEVYEFVLRRRCELRFSPAVEAAVRETAKNPKRLQRDARRQMSDMGVGTKSQQALKLQHEQNKQERRAKSREQREAEAEHRFELKRQKKREKRRGH